MLGSSDLVAFVPTTDLTRARAFYEDVLGLRALDDTPIACVFDAHGTTLRVTLVGEISAAAYTVLGWSVVDIGAVVRQLTDKGIEFERFTGMDQDELGVWRSPGGDKVAWFKDPDGNVLSLTEPFLAAR